MNEPRVRGTATAEDVAAIAAVLCARAPAAPGDDAYRRWRRTCIEARRATAADEPRDRGPR